MTVRHGRMQRVEWVDSCGHSGWNDPKTRALNVARCVTVGMRVKGPKDAVCLVLSWSHYGDVGDVMSIPRCCVRKIEDLVIKGQK